MDIHLRFKLSGLGDFMIIETLLILFLFSLFSKGAKNKKEALEIINKDLNALTILSYFKENTKNNVVMSASPGRISEVLNVDLTELEPSFDVLSEKKLVKRYIRVTKTAL